MGLSEIIQRRAQATWGWPEWIGKGGRNRPESVAGMRRNTQFPHQGCLLWFFASHALQDQPWRDFSS
jgi:hypothetical protein